MFLTGPGVVREVMGEDVDADELGGPKVHERNGVCHFVAADDARRRAARARPARPPARSTPASRRRAGAAASPRRRRPGRRPCRTTSAQGLRRARRRSAAIVDGGRAARVSRRAGRATSSRALRAHRRAAPVGVVANQPQLPRRRARRRRPSQKAARFVRTCNAFGLPLVVLVDTPGLHARHAGRSSGGVIRHGAKLVHAFAEADGAEGDRRAAQGLRRRASSR